MFFTRQFCNGYPIIPLHGSATMRILYSDRWNVALLGIRHYDVWIVREARKKKRQKERMKNKK
jgi:hypothetical protein